MGRVLLALVFVLAAAALAAPAPAHAQEDVCIDTAGLTWRPYCVIEESDKCVSYDFAGSKYCVISDTLGYQPTPAGAKTGAPAEVALTAYGEGVPTTCTIDVIKGMRSFGGTTSCSRAVTQTAQASTSGGATVTGSLCSGFRASCTSSGTTIGPYATLRYRVTLVAPLGQGWVAPPSECAGAGTDKLDCTFTY